MALTRGRVGRQLHHQVGRIHEVATELHDVVDAPVEEIGGNEVLQIRIVVGVHWHMIGLGDEVSNLRRAHHHVAEQLLR
jgi:hypothetical protein